MMDLISSVFSALGELAMSVGMKIVYVIVLLIVGLKLIKFICKKFQNSRLYANMEASVAKFLVSAMKVALYLFLFISCALVLGVPAASFVAVLGSAGLAVGLALQGSLSNLAGSIMILLFKPFKVGDYIEVSGYAGTVDEINIFYTVINTVDNKRITLPNGSVSGSTIVDYSTNPKRRVDLTFGAAYGTDVEKMKSIMLEAAKNHKLVLDDPEPVALFTAQSASSLDFVLRAWCNGSDYWTVHFDLLEQIHAAMNREGIEIPFPQMDVHVKN